MRVLEFTIQGRPPTPNERVHWRAQMKPRALWRAKAKDAALVAIDNWVAVHGAWSPMTYVAELVAVLIVPTQAVHDWDNGVASLKPCFDGIREAGVMADDDTRHVRSAGRIVDYVYIAGLSQVRFRVTEGRAPNSLGL